MTDVVNATDSRRVRAIRRLASRVGLALTDCNEVVGRLITLAGTPARYPADPDVAPDTYFEFLVRNDPYS